MKAIAFVILCPHLAHADAATGLPIFVEDRPKPDPRDTGSETYLTLGLLTAPTGGWFGLRAQLDLISVANLSLGAAGTLFGRGVGVELPELTASAVGYVAYTAPLFRNLDLRGQLGFGGAIKADKDETTMMVTTTRSQLVEGSLLLSGRATHDWAVLGGPIVQRSTSADEIDTSVMLFVGLRRRY